MKKTKLRIKHFSKLFNIVILLMLVSALQLKSQTVLYSTDFGTTPNVNPTGWTFSGVGMNTSTNTPSSGYTGATGGVYLGEGNSVTFTNTSGSSQASSPIGYSEAVLLTSSTGYSNIVLSFGMRKSSASYNSNATYTLEWSTNGTAYNPIVYTEATAGSWGLASGAGLSLPSGANNQANLYFRWSFNRTGTGSNFKIDDVAVTSNTTVVTPVTVAFLSNDTTVREAAGSANFYVRLTSTSTASSAVTISVSPLSNASAADYTISAITLTFAANAPVNSTYPVNISLNDDALVESSEYFIATLGNLQNATVGTISQFAFYIADNDKVIPSPSNAITLNLLSSFSNTVSGSNSAEIVAHDPTTQRLYIANSIGGKLDIIDFVNPSAPTLINSLNITSYGNINCVAVYNGTVAAAIENGLNPQDSGRVVFFDKDGLFISQVKVGMMPDMLTFNNAGTKVLTANEGEPNSAYSNDPDGSVSIINISGGVTALTQSNVAHATFTVYNGQEASLRAQGIRIYGLGANAAKDFEPEYIAVAKDDSKAWVTLQENNAVAEIDLTTNSVTAVRALGTKDHSILDNGLDASNTTRSVNIANFPIKGMYLPDAIATYSVGGVNYIITANEGDARAYSGFSEEVRLSAANLDATKFPFATQMKNNFVLGRLNITNKTGDTDNDGDLDTLYSYGSRSFSIWNANTGVQVYDSKDDLEMITATNSYSVLFNASNTNNTRKDRSDDKGPEPEGVTIGTIGANTYAFIALERIGGVMVYNINNPAAPVFVTYANNRSLPSGGPDNGSEGIVFIPQSQSPNGQHILITANEISSTLSIWGIAGCPIPLSSSVSVSGATTAICSNNSPTLSVASNSNVSYQWSRDGLAISGATANIVVANLTGSYSVAINGGANCSTGSLARTFSVNASPVLSINGNSVVCDGTALTQTVSGAATYTWSNGFTTAAVVFTPTASSIYSVTGTATNNCTSVITRSVTVNANPTLSITNTPLVICNGFPVNYTVSGANNYSWTNGPTTNTVSFTPTASVVYSVTGTNTNNCSSSLTSSVTVNANPSLTITNTPLTICNGASVTFTASGANSYSWINGPTTNTANFTPTASAVYIVVGTSTAGCTSIVVRSVTVNANPTLTITNTPLTICNGAAVNFTVSGANSYSWTNGPTSNIVSFTPTASVGYSVTGTDLNNCSGTASRSVTVNANPSLTITNTPLIICNGNQVNFSVTGANSYSWTNGPTTNTANFTPTASVVYSVTGTDLNNCSSTTTRSVTVNANPTLSIQSSALTICNGAVVNFTASGANSYSWTNGPSANTASFTPTLSTVYSVTGTNTNNCNGTTSVSVTVNANPTLSINGGSVSICAGSSLNLIANGANSYTWNNGANTTTLNVAPQTNTSYTLNGSNANGCFASAVTQVTVNQLPPVTISSSTTQVCVGQSATLTAGGATSFSWTPGGATTAVFVVTPTINTVFLVVGKDNNNCTKTAAQTINVNALPVLNISSTSSVICSGASATLQIGGATTYSWNNGIQAPQIVVSPSLTTTYTVVGTSSLNCAASAVFTQTVNACTGLAKLTNNVVDYILYPNPAKTTVSLSFEQSGSVEVKIYNAVGALLLSESNYHSNETINIEALSKGIYFISVSDKNRQVLKKLVIE